MNELGFWGAGWRQRPGADQATLRATIWILRDDAHVARAELWSLKGIAPFELTHG